MILATALLFLARFCLCISEDNFNATYVREVDPFFFSGETKKFTGKDNVEINYWYRLSPTHSPSNPSKALVISPGRNCPLRNFAELFYDLNSPPYNLNLSFYILDHRGQGDSGLVDPAKDIYKISDIIHFDDYVADFDKFYTNIVADNQHSMHFVLGDSMGGMIASLYMAQNPSSFQAAILSTPMYGIQSGFPDWFARIVTSSATWLGLGAKPALGQKPFSGSTMPDSGIRTTSSAARYYLGQEFEIKVKDPLGGVSNRWVAEVLKTCGSFSHSKTTIPIPSIMFQSGLELVVDPAPQTDVCKRSLNCELTVFDHAYHEILFERDEIRNKAVDTIASFINNSV